MPLSVRENMFLNPAANGRRAFDWRRPERRSSAMRNCCAARFGVRPSDPTRPAETLSGGNQQKVVIARWLEIAETAADPRGADCRGRRRRQGRDLRAAQRRPRAGAGHPGDRHGFRGGRQHLPSRPGVQSWPGGRRDRPRPALSVETILHAASAGGHSSPSAQWCRHEHACARPHWSRPAPSCATAVDRAAHRAVDPGLRPGDPDAAPRAAVLAAPARDLPDAAQSALDPERQVAHRAPVAGGDDPDDDRQDRPDGRLRHRALAHPGDHLADPRGPALACSHPAGRAGRRLRSAGSTAFWWRSRTSTASSPRSARAP